jgi:hypothetical protein
VTRKESKPKGAKPAIAKTARKAEVWQRLHDRFADLAAIANKSSPLPDYPLLLECYYSDSDVTNPVGTFDNGKWALQNEPELRDRYRRIAIDAGRAFGARGIGGFKMWAHHLCLHVITENLPYQFNGRSVQIQNPCEVSAAYCKSLRDQAQAPSAPPLNAERPRIGERITVTYLGEPLPGVPPDRLLAVNAAPSPSIDSEPTLAEPQLLPVMRQIPAKIEETKPSAEPSNGSWQKIEISFLSDERVEICKGSKRETLNYSEFGFADRRNGKPNRAWVMLRDLSGRDGAIPTSEIQGNGLAQLQKRIEEIRKRFRSHFGINTDSIPFNGTSYRVSFKLTRRPSFDA